jgi:hypothetical protein
MRDNRRVVYVLWTVITILILGGAVGGFLLVKHSNDLSDQNLSLNDDNASLRNQLNQAKAALAATPTPTPTPTATPAPAHTPTPSPAKAGVHTPTPTPTPSPTKH